MAVGAGHLPRGGMLAQRAPHSGRRPQHPRLPGRVGNCRLRLPASPAAVRRPAPQHVRCLGQRGLFARRAFDALHADAGGVAAWLGCFPPQHERGRVDLFAARAGERARPDLRRGFQAGLFQHPRAQPGKAAQMKKRLLGEQPGKSAWPHALQRAQDERGIQVMAAFGVFGAQEGGQFGRHVTRDHIRRVGDHAVILRLAFHAPQRPQRRGGKLQVGGRQRPLSARGARRSNGQGRTRQAQRQRVDIRAVQVISQRGRRRVHLRRERCFGRPARLAGAFLLFAVHCIQQRQRGQRYVRRAAGRVKQGDFAQRSRLARLAGMRCARCAHSAHSARR